MIQCQVNSWLAIFLLDVLALLVGFSYRPFSLDFICLQNFIIYPSILLRCKLKLCRSSVKFITAKVFFFIFLRLWIFWLHGKEKKTLIFLSRGHKKQSIFSLQKSAHVLDEKDANLCGRDLSPFGCSIPICPAQGVNITFWKDFGIQRLWFVTWPFLLVLHNSVIIEKLHF